MKNKSENKNKEIVFTVEQPDELLKFLYEMQPDRPKGKVKSELEHKLVSVDGKVVTKFNYALRKGQQVTIGTYVPKFEKVSIPNLEIIYEDDELLVINKPAGMLAIATETEKNMTAYHLAMEYVRLKNSRGRIFIVHRLDRETSGVLIFAKNEEIKHALQDNWDSVAQFRGYIAIVEGCPKPMEGRIENKLRETDSHLVYTAKMGDGKLAITNYKVRKQGENYSLVDVNIETGRKNQIRVHMSDMGCPIAGDKKYGAKTNPVRRLCLHANKLVIKHPYTDEEMIFSTPVPKKMMQALNK